MVLCLHGCPDCRDSFRHQLPALAEAGYRGVSASLRGYEPSSQPGPEPRHYHPLRIARDAVAWAGQLGEGRPVHLVGHDWGAIASYPACALAPERFASLATLAVAGPGAMSRALTALPSQLLKSWYVFFFQLRGLAERRVAKADFAFLERLWRDWSPGFSWEPEAMEAVKETFRQPGVVRSALGTYRALLNPRLPDSKQLRELGRRPQPVPTLALTGARDGCLDTRLHDLMEERDFASGLHVARVPDAGHFLHQERPDVVNGLLLDWLATHPS